MKTLIDAAQAVGKVVEGVEQDYAMVAVHFTDDTSLVMEAALHYEDEVSLNFCDKIDMYQAERLGVATEAELEAWEEPSRKEREAQIEVYEHDELKKLSAKYPELARELVTKESGNG